MTVHTKKIEPITSISETKEVLKSLKTLLTSSVFEKNGSIDPEIKSLLNDLSTLGKTNLNSDYPNDFIPNDEYLKTLPSAQE